MKGAQSKLALLGDVSLQPTPLPSPLPAGGEAPSGEAPSTNAVAEDQLPPQKEEPKDKKKKTVTEAADLMIAAMDRKNPPPKATAKSKCQPTGNEAIQAGEHEAKGPGQYQKTECRPQAEGNQERKHRCCEESALWPRSQPRPVHVQDWHFWTWPDNSHSV